MPTGETPLIEVSNLTFQYRDAPVLAVKGVSFSVFPGDRVLVIGHNGSGKSTLLSLLAGQRKPFETHDGAPCAVRVMGHDPFNVTRMAAEISRVGPPWPREACFANTIDRVTTPAPFPERKETISKLLHLNLSRHVDKLSSGEKRRVQMLHAFLHPATIYLLDECSTDVDVPERRTILDLVLRECTARGGCCLYATHIFERLDDAGWATHVLFMRGGEAVEYLSMAEVLSRHPSVEAYAFACMSEAGTAAAAAGGAFDTESDRAVYRDILAENPSFFAAGTPTQAETEAEEVVRCRNLSYLDVFRGMSFSVRRGERCLLLGCNGSGKSTLLNMLAGKQFFANKDGALQVFGKVCYADMTLNAAIAYGGDWWTQTPGGEVHVREMLTIDSRRAEYLRSLLAVDLDWDVRHISAGEQKRVQLLFNLLRDKPLVLLDEATSDLDVDQRHRLLKFLYLESTYRGVTVVYSTHIFGGLQGWASVFMILDRTKRGVHAIWREAEGEALDFERLTNELVELKSKEVF